MIIRKEDMYKINNIESAVHCFYEIRPALSKEILKKHIYHYHEYIEFLFFPEGEGIVWINEIANYFSPGTFIIVNSGKPHFVHFHKTGKIICIKFLPQILYENEQSFLYFKYVSPFVSIGENRYIFSASQIQHTPIIELLQEIISEWDVKDDTYELIIRANILKIIANTFRILKKNGFFYDDTKFTPEIKKSLSYITANYQTINEKELSNICGLSPNYFSMLFKKQMNISFRDYLVNIKIAESEKLLLTTSKSITDIATEVGFSTTSHYISLFHKKKGITPAQFRKLKINDYLQ